MTLVCENVLLEGFVIILELKHELWNDMERMYFEIFTATTSNCFYCFVSDKYRMRCDSLTSWHQQLLNISNMMMLLLIMMVLQHPLCLVIIRPDSWPSSGWRTKLFWNTLYCVISSPSPGTSEHDTVLSMFKEKLLKHERGEFLLGFL